MSTLQQTQIIAARRFSILNRVSMNISKCSRRRTNQTHAPDTDTDTDTAQRTSTHERTGALPQPDGTGEAAATGRECARGN